MDRMQNEHEQQVEALTKQFQLQLQSRDAEVARLRHVVVSLSGDSRGFIGPSGASASMALIRPV